MGDHTKRRRLNATVVGMSSVLALGGLATVTSTAHAATCEKVGTTVTCTYGNPNVAESFVVPAGLTSATVSLAGGGGGAGAVVNDGTPAAGGGGFGGAGGTSTATLALTPGTTLGIYVGAPGGDGSGCSTTSTGGAGGKSGGIVTGGVGGDGAGASADDACAGGGGGGGSFIMANGQTPTSPGATPVLAAGGGGGGGGSLPDEGSNDGGDGAGSPNGIAFDGGGAGYAGGVAGSEGGAAGGAGDDASWTSGENRHAGGGGGGGYRGGGGGASEPSPAEALAGGGGGGGQSYPQTFGDNSVAPGAASPGLNAALPARVVGPVTYGVATAGTPGTLTITYTAPPTTTPVQNPADTADCTPGNACVATPPDGEETEFKVTGFGGSDGASLFAILNGGTPPTCQSAPKTLSPDWVQFGFENPKDGRTWSKRIRVTGTDPVAKSTARRILAETQICFAAPYKFVTKRGEKLTKVGGNWEGLLAHCQSRIVAQAKKNHPKLARPCIEKRTLVSHGDGWVVRVNYFVPNGELDPKGRSVRKKGKKKK